MVFSSLRFFVFLYVVLVLFGVWRGGSLRARKAVLAIASCLFYAAWDWRYLGLLLAISVIDYFCAARIHATDDRGARKRWLAASVVSNLAILGYFKYTGFFLDNLNGLFAWFGVHVEPWEILLPAGISFYTFKSLSYTIDVYRREIEPCRSQLDYTTFVTFFPELIAGPIVRASVFLPQLERRIGPTADRLASGASLFLLGLTKKVLIADNLAPSVDAVFADPAAFSAGSLWLATLGYGLQIYCDFAGYSDMAIGTARMIGYDLPRNFDMPYASASITDFWRRWHMTLSAWLRDYLYIPLGGNRHGRAATYRNLFLTMLLGGLWHGSSWNFVLWGALHGLALGAHKWIRERAQGDHPAARGSRIPAALGWAATFVFVQLCWVPFRAADFETTAIFLGRMFTLQPGIVWVPSALVWGSGLVLAGHAIGLWCSGRIPGAPPPAAVLERAGLRQVPNPVAGWSVTLRAGTLPGAFLATLWVLVLYYFARVGGSPFIYFQF